MAEFYVETTIKFSGTIEAENLDEALEIGYYYDNLNYDCVVDVEAEQISEDEDEDY